LTSCSSFVPIAMTRNYILRLLNWLLAAGAVT
jgi:hypothetical protein